MKKIILFFLIFFCPKGFASSEWLPIGAKWYYNFQELLPFNADGYIKYTVERDTVVRAKPSKIISKTTINYKGQRLKQEFLLMSEENGKIYFIENDSFLLKYDFTLKEGDKMRINISKTGCDSVSPVIVDSISEVKVNGTPLKILYYSYIGYNTIYNNKDYKFIKKAIEKIGSETNFLNEINSCSISDNFTYTGLRCYKDLTLEYHSDWWTTVYKNILCDTLINTGIKKNENSNFLRIYPNPTNNIFSIESNILIESVEIYSELGCKIKRIEVVNSNKVDIKINELSKGSYIIIINSKSENRFYSKIIKY